MVDMPIVVVLINKSLIRAASVSGSNIQDPIEMEWKSELLNRAFQVIKDRYNSARIRLILDDDLSHTLDLDIPVAPVGQNERELVEAKLKEQIPDVLTAGNWDYKVKSENESTKTVTVFVPVQETFIPMTEAAKKAGIEIEAVEPISISASRDPNPFIGMAKKEDLRGDDDEVLNIQPIFSPQEESGMLSGEDMQDNNSFVTTPTTSTENVSRVDGGNKKKKLGKTFIILGIVILVALLAVGIVTAVRNNAPAEPSPTPTPVATPTPTPSPTPEPVVLGDLKVQVLNGSGTPGEAGKVAKKLESADFTDIDTGNADSYDYKSTEVRVRPDMSDSVYEAIKTALAGDYTVTPGDPLTASSDYDVVVIVGVNANATPTPKPTSTATPKPSTTSSPSPSASSSPSPSASASPSPSPSASASN